MFNEVYQSKLTELADLVKTGDKDALLASNLLPEIKELLAQGADVNHKDLYGNTLLHLVASHTVFSNLSQEQSRQNQYENVLDVPTIISWFKPNPFVKDNTGLTASFLAAYYGNTKEHAMLLSYENAYSAAKIGLALLNISKVQVHTRYVDPQNGIQISAAADQKELFFEMRRQIDSISRELNA